jgi:hypothetical protein
MLNDSNRTGSCLCRAVRVTTHFEEVSLGACHCRVCRTWSGGPFMELECGSNVTFEGADNIAVYASSDWAERGFCKNCGTHIFMRSKDGASFGIPAGLFDSDEGIVFDRQVFFDKKPAYYSFSNQTRNITSDYIYERYPHLRQRDK